MLYGEFSRIIGAIISYRCVIVVGIEQWWRYFRGRGVYVCKSGAMSLSEIMDGEFPDKIRESKETRINGEKRREAWSVCFSVLEKFPIMTVNNYR